MNHGMDIYAGSAICLGPNNFLSDYYNSTPVGITVEGSNTLTRSLIIFGQGLNKSHPYIYDIFNNIQEDDIDGFRTNFNNMLLHAVRNYLGSVDVFPMNKTLENRIERLIIKYSTLANFIALLGGKIKQKQMISGNMADILSNIYLIHSVQWYHNVQQPNLAIVENACIEYLLVDAERKLNNVVDNYPEHVIRNILKPIKMRGKKISFDRIDRLCTFIQSSSEVRKTLKEDLFMEGTVLEKLDRLDTLVEGSPEYDQLYNEVIQVGEFSVQKKESQTATC